MAPAFLCIFVRLIRVDSQRSGSSRLGITLRKASPSYTPEEGDARVRPPTGPGRGIELRLWSQGFSNIQMLAVDVFLNAAR